MRAAVIVAMLGLSGAAVAQEGPQATQMLVAVHAKGDAPAAIDAKDLRLQLNGKPVEVETLVPARASGGIQVALLIDEGLRLDVGRELGALRNFVQTLPPNVEVLVGYMQSGSVVSKGGFTSDRGDGAKQVHMPMGTAGGSGSPYFCLSDFVKKWPGGDVGKARVVLMITNGVDPYNGSTRMNNQDSGYVEAAQHDAERAGVAVYSIYYGDAGYRGDSASLSGQGYLRQVADATGGDTYYQGTGSPVSLEPFLAQFKRALDETYVATFMAEGKDLLRVKVASNVKDVKVRAPEGIRAGNHEAFGSR